MNNINKNIQDLIEISRFFGGKKEFAIAGGGNTSWKDKDVIYVKARGANLASIDEDGFTVLSRKALAVLYEKDYPGSDIEREEEISRDLMRSALYPENARLASVETSIHNLIDYAFVVHTHPTLINGLMCSKKAKELSGEIFGDEALFIPFTIPGYDLFKAIESGLDEYRKNHNSEPKLLLLENHGVFVSADTIEEIKTIYDDLYKKLRKHIQKDIPEGEIDFSAEITDILPGIRAIFSRNQRKIVKIRNNELVKGFLGDDTKLDTVRKPFILDHIKYCGAAYVWDDLKKHADAEAFLVSIKGTLAEFEKKNGRLPELMIIKNLGLISVASNVRSAEALLDVFEDQMKISFYARNFGGEQALPDKEIGKISLREEHERKISASEGRADIVRNKVIVVTGGAQGFGKGIVEELYREGANIVLADINEEKGQETALEISKDNANNKVVFVKTDVSSFESFGNLVFESVKEFGAVDAFISNAGILRAGNLDEMDPKTFDLMTKINYSAYFYGTKAFNPVFMLQNKYNKTMFFDVIQVNSKSGLKGSNKNFAYAGGKFGGIGLTQSFALEMMPYNVKVNSICPGNFFDGPLWADPENGLFVQYLNAGKVKGAKSIEDVKKYYEAMVPANRGCTVIDVARAVLYVIEQEYETGQAVPVTGGQNMLN